MTNHPCFYDSNHVELMMIISRYILDNILTKAAVTLPKSATYSLIISLMSTILMAINQNKCLGSSRNWKTTAGRGGLVITLHGKPA